MSDAFRANLRIKIEDGRETIVEEDLRHVNEIIDVIPARGELKEQGWKLVASAVTRDKDEMDELVDWLKQRVGDGDITEIEIDPIEEEEEDSDTE